MLQQFQRSVVHQRSVPSSWYGRLVNRGHDHSPFTIHHSPTLVRRITLYSAAVLVSGILLYWGTGKVQAINDEMDVVQTAAAAETQASLVEALSRSNVSAFTLAERGFALLVMKDRTSEASLYLQAAALKDTNYRDAALYAGAAELALADSAWQSAPLVATAHTKLARQFLEQARAIDPIHAETFRLLAIAYTNLGQGQLATEARQKADLFASVGQDS